MALLASMGDYGAAKALAYGRVRATGTKWIDQTNVLECPQIDHAYSNGDTLSDGTNLQYCTTGGYSGSSLSVTWNPTVGGFTTWGSATFINQGATNGSGTQYGLWVLGEGEWDGFDTIWNQGSVPLLAIGYNYDISSGSYNEWGAGGAGVGLNPPLIHFHSGTDGALGSALPTPTSNGPDQGCDNFISLLPPGAAIIAQCYSRMAYYMMQWLPQDLITYTSASINQSGQIMNPIGDWRALRCRIFDDMGNQVGYEWTQNPAWHWVDAWIRCCHMPRSEYQLNMSLGPPYITTPETLPSDVIDKFDWGSVYEFAQDCDYTLANGFPRFVGNYAFAAQTTLQAITEMILQSARGYQQEYAGKLFVQMDKPRSSVFVLTDQHQLPYSLAVDNKEVHQNGNDLTLDFLDTNLPAVEEITSITFVIPGPGPYVNGQATIVTPTENPCASWDVIQTGGNSNPLLNRKWMVNNIIDDYTFTCQPISPDMASDESGTGGVFGYPQSRFNKRAPELWHQAHAVARGQIGP